MIRDLQDEIIRLKKERGVALLAHSYQAREILEIADVAGDSFQLSLAAQKLPEQEIVLCGVHFMAETAKILSPQKKVVLANPEAGCPMAEQIEPELLVGLKRKYPDHAVVCYINTTAALKTECDVCVTSSSAVKIIRAMDADKILFVPDCNLGQYVADQVPEKTFQFVQGGCPIHAVVTAEDVRRARETYPDALLLVHPECVPAVVRLEDYVGSTSGIMDYAKASSAKEFIIGTEMSIVEHLSYDAPDKRFYPLSKKMLCMNMRLTTLVDVYRAVRGQDGLEIDMSDDLIARSRTCIDAMMQLGK
jgi:quinolinate synthase